MTVDPEINPLSFHTLPRGYNIRVFDDDMVHSVSICESGEGWARITTSCERGIEFHSKKTIGPDYTKDPLTCIVCIGSSG